LTNAVIDNSTLTAVERVLGRIPVACEYDLSGDLAAFEAYLVALLFYDNPSRIDDYKAEHSKERAAFFTDIGAVQFEDKAYGVLLNTARQLAENMFLKIHGGDLDDSIVSDFLKDIDLFVCPAWQMQSSDFYLRIRLLSDKTGVESDKYTPLMTAIFDQLSENNRTHSRPNWKKELIGSDGKIIKDSAGSDRKKRKIASDVNAFAASLNWLALRSVFYAICSEHLGATAICHPIRSDFLAQFYTSRLNSMRSDGRAAVLKYFQSTALSTVNASNELIGLPALKIRTPLISAWAVLKTGSPSKARDYIIDKRYSPEGLALRARMRDIEDLHNEGNVGRARERAGTLFRDLDMTIGAFTRKYGKSSSDPYDISADIVSMSGSFKVIPALKRIGSLFPSRRKSVSLLRNITVDLLQSPTLGRVSDTLRSEMQTPEATRVSYQPNIEHPRFRYVRSDWKIPM